MSEISGSENLGTSPLVGDGIKSCKKVLSPEKLEQRRKALEKANAVRSEKASLKKREKEIQKKVYENYKKDIESTEEKVFRKPHLVEKDDVPDGLLAIPGAMLNKEIQKPHENLKHIKIENKRKKKVVLEWSDSDSDVDDERVRMAFKNYRKKAEVKPVEPSMSTDDYQKTLLRARYGDAVKRIVNDNVSKQEEVVKYYHGSGW